MRITLLGCPISQSRPRFVKGRVFDPKGDIKKRLKWEVVSQIKNLASKFKYNEALGVDLRIYSPIPKSLSNSKRKALDDTHDTNTPDIDNYAKFTLDLLNKIAYEDDRYIARLHVEKRKSLIPRTEIFIYSLEDSMIHEHAITIKNEMLPADLEYLIKKSNRIGMSGREVSRVYSQEDSEGKHIYFECDILKTHKE